MGNIRKKFRIVCLFFGILALILVLVLSGVRIRKELLLKEQRQERVVDNAFWEVGIIEYEGKFYRYKDEIKTYLVMGIDSMDVVKVQEDWHKGGQADALFLVIEDPKEKKISLLALNRNTITDIKVYASNHKFIKVAQRQLCLAHGYGDGDELSNERQVEAVSNLMNGLPIDGFVAVNKGAIGSINEALGQVEVEALYDIRDVERDVSIEKGEVIELNELQAFSYVSWRDIEDLDSANKRLERQKQYIKCAYEQALNGDKNKLLIVYDIYMSLPNYIRTDIDVFNAVHLLMGYDINIHNIHQIEGQSYVGDTGLVEFHIDEQSKIQTILDLYYEEVDKNQIK